MNRNQKLFAELGLRDFDSNQFQPSKSHAYIGYVIIFLTISISTLFM